MLFINNKSKKVVGLVAHINPFIKEGKVIDSIFVDIEHFILNKEYKTYYDNNDSYTPYKSIEKC